MSLRIHLNSYIKWDIHPIALKIVKLPHKEAKKVSEGSHCSKTKIGPNHSLHRNLDNTTSLTLNCMLVNAKGRKDEKVDK